MFADARREGVVPHLIADLDRPIHPISDARAFADILRLIRQTRPHIVHTHTTKAGVLGRLAAMACRVPIIVHTFHGHVFSGYFSEIGSLAAVTLERILAAKTDRLVTLSPSLREDLLQRLRPAHPERVRVIPLGLPLQRLVAAARHTGRFRHHLGLSAEDCLFGIIARLVPVKNHALLIEAMSHLAARHPRLHLAIVGGGEQSSTLKHHAKELGLSDRIHFTGIFHPIEDVYADLDVLLLTSLNEGTPVVLMEALAAGCPIAATVVGGVADVLQQAGCGTRLPGDILGLVGVLSELASSRQQCYSLSPEVRIATAQRYSREKLAERTADLYRPLLEQRVSEYLTV